MSGQGQAPRSSPGTPREPGRARCIAVALHGIEPATFERCALIRDWLYDHGVDRVTLLVIPARDLHPVGERSPEMVAWLEERGRAGDTIAQHGFQHVPLRRAGRSLPLGPCRRRGEFSRLDLEETRRAVAAGWRVLKLAGIEPEGFVAPAYAYTGALHATLRERFRWWAGLLRIHRGTAPGARGRTLALAPAFGLAPSGRLPRLISPPLVRAGSVLSPGTLRVDVHPGDLAHSRHMLALEWVLGRDGNRRTAVTYRELAGV
jgi:predicted deacetylase